MKTCVECSALKNLEDFPKKKDMKDGRRNCCKVCFQSKIKITPERKAYLKAYNKENNVRVSELRKQRYERSKHEKML